MRLVVLFLFSVFLFSKNIDCSITDSKIEDRICSNRNILFLDKTMNFIYDNIVNNFNDNHDFIIDNIITSQKYWIESRNDCEDDICLIREYIDRINEMIFDCIDPIPSIERSVAYMGYWKIRRSFSYRECMEKSHYITSEIKKCINEDINRITQYTYYLESRIKRMLKYAVKKKYYVKESYDRFLKMIELHKLYKESRCSLYMKPVPGTADFLDLDDCYLEEEYRWLYELKKIDKTIVGVVYDW